ncbi:hypothetical protein [Alteraurantiacibacter aquimixticola]|uniref:Glycerophosphoryl diester phosphodiesterase membrane domain-containing protein n=1 Tax=Alteraurantiacibacter aquimixticola TaxID=2489173 RepID=A0A4T3F2Q8_9SPHN|nr:hypothetical protein [Alteraurantiacibacter aquimixticola]TIX51418.1 hypothetical protein E5222_02855 [Alteraurantiacibacter aquimixticola]
MALSAGRILSGTWGVVARCFPALMGMWLLYFAIYLAASLLFALVIGMSAYSSSEIGNTASLYGFADSILLGMVLFYLGWILLWLAQLGSMTAKASPVQDIAFGEAVSAGVRSCLTLFVVTVLLGALGILALLISAVIARISGLSDELAGLGGLAVVLVPAIYLWSRLSLVVPIAAIEGGRNPFKIMARSWRLTRAHWNAIFVAAIGFAVLQLLLGLMLFVPVWLFEGGPSETTAIVFIFYLIFGFAGFAALSSIAQAAFIATIHGEITGTADAKLGETFA